MCLFVGHVREPCTNDRDAVWVELTRVGPEPCIRWGRDPSTRFSLVVRIIALLIAFL